MTREQADALIAQGNFTTELMQYLGFDVSTPEKMAKAILALTTQFFPGLPGTATKYVKSPGPSPVYLKTPAGKVVAKFHTLRLSGGPGWTAVDLNTAIDPSAGTEFGPYFTTPRISSLYNEVEIPVHQASFIIPVALNTVNQVALVWSGASNIYVMINAAPPEGGYEGGLKSANNPAVMFFIGDHSGDEWANYGLYFRVISGSNTAYDTTPFQITDIWVGNAEAPLEYPAGDTIISIIDESPGLFPLEILSPAKLAEFGVSEFTMPPTPAIFTGGALDELTAPPLPAAFSGGAIERTSSIIEAPRSELLRGGVLNHTGKVIRIKA